MDVAADVNIADSDVAATGSGSSSCCAAAAAAAIAAIPSAADAVQKWPPPLRGGFFFMGTAIFRDGAASGASGPPAFPGLQAPDGSFARRPASRSARTIRLRPVSSCTPRSPHRSRKQHFHL